MKCGCIKQTSAENVPADVWTPKPLMEKPEFSCIEVLSRAQVPDHWGTYHCQSLGFGPYVWNMTFSLSFAQDTFHKKHTAGLTLCRGVWGTVVQAAVRFLWITFLYLCVPSLRSSRLHTVIGNAFEITFNESGCVESVSVYLSKSIK